jgi:hypothetical protein
MRAPLFLLCLLNIEQHILMYARDELDLFQELYSSILHIGGIINHVGQSVQMIVRPETR